MSKLKDFCKSEAVQAVAALFSSNLLSAFVGVLASLIQGRFLTSEELGYFGQFGISTNYVFFLNLGVFYAVERLVPYYFGRGNKEKAEETIRVGEAWILFICIPVSGVFFFLSAKAFLKGNWKAGLGWMAQIFAIFTQLYSGFIKITYRSGQDFKRLAKGQIYVPFMYLLCLPIYWIQAYFALFMRTISTIVSDVMIYRSRPFKVKPKFNKHIFFSMIRQGFPLFFSYYILTTGLTAVQSTLIIKLLDISSLGYWNFANMLLMYARNLPNAITAVFVPRIVQKYGETHNMQDALSEALKPLKIALFANVLIIIVGCAGTLKVLPYILPNYSGATLLICLLLVSMPLYLVSLLETVLMAANRLKIKVIGAVCNFIIQITISVLLCTRGVGIYSFAWGAMIGYMIEGIIFSFYLFYKKYVND